MATKSQLITSVNGHLTEVIDISDHRASMLDLINQLYPVAVTDTQITETYTTKSGSTITYSLSFIKHGNAVHVTGTVANLTGTVSLDNFDIFTWKNTEYKPISGTSQNFKDVTNTVEFILKNTSFGTVGVIPPGSFKFEYKFYVAQE